MATLGSVGLSTDLKWLYRVTNGSEPIARREARTDLLGVRGGMWLKQRGALHREFNRAVTPKDLVSLGVFCCR